MLVSRLPSFSCTSRYLATQRSRQTASPWDTVDYGSIIGKTESSNEKEVNYKAAHDCFVSILNSFTIENQRILPLKRLGWSRDQLGLAANWKAQMQGSCLWITTYCIIKDVCSDVVVIHYYKQEIIIFVRSSIYKMNSWTSFHASHLGEFGVMSNIL